MRYLIYCDESDDKGSFYSNFYGGSLLLVEDHEVIEAALNEAKGNLKGSEFKWTKIGPANEGQYTTFMTAYFELIKANFIKFRAMFTQNINQTKGLVEYENDDEFFLLYYQFVKHAFGLRFCNGTDEDVRLTVFLDEVPISGFNLFRKYLSDLCDYPFFKQARIIIPYEDITSVNSEDHVILQATDVVLGAIQFKLNNKHLNKPDGARIRGKRTRAKERVYKHVNKLIREIYPHFNVGITTGQVDVTDRWEHPYRHWC